MRAAGTYSEAAGVAQRLGGAALMDDGGEAGDEGRLHPRRPEHISGREMRDVVGDLQAHGASAETGHGQDRPAI